MSYEGYTEFLCARGHRGTRDAYDGVPAFCAHKDCGKEIVWSHEVDQTNGAGKPWNLKVRACKETTCGHCGHTETVVLYRIPKKKRRRQ